MWFTLEMAKRYELTIEQYERVRELLPGKKSDPGRTARDNRAFLNGVLWVLRSGAHWHDMPSRYGKWKSTHQRFSRWARNGIWEKVFAQLIRDPKSQYVMIDSTLVKAHQSAVTGKRGRPSRLWGDPVED